MASGDVLRTFDAPSTEVSGLAWDGRTLWATKANLNGIIHQVDPADGASLKSFASPSVPNSLAWDGRTLWAATAEVAQDLIYQIDPADGTVLKTIPAPAANVTSLAWVQNRLWAYDRITLLIYLLDPNDGTVLRSFAGLNSSIRALVAIRDKLLAAFTLDNSIKLIDPLSGAVELSFASPGPNPAGMTWDGRALWVSDSSLSEISQVAL